MANSKTARCSSGACARVTEDEAGFRFTSTTPGNDGALTLTAEETAQLFADVKAGHFDDMHRAARERAERTPVIA